MKLLGSIFIGSMDVGDQASNDSINISKTQNKFFDEYTNFYLIKINFYNFIF
jgi:hypothetical protein